MLKRIMILTCAVVFLVVPFFTGCAKTGGNPPEVLVTPPPATPEPTPREPSFGGTLKLSMRPPKTLNPLLNEDVTVNNILRLVYEPLAVLDENQKPVSNLADFNFSSDGTSVTLTLKDGLQWSNGTAVTSKDVTFSIEMLKNAPDTVIYKKNVRNISSFTAPNTKTVNISFNQAFSGAPYLLCFPVISEAYYRNEKNPQSDKNMKPVGNGAFEFVSYENTRKMKLKATNNTTTAAKIPYIENVEVVVTPDFETDLNSFGEGIIDVVSSSVSDWGKYRSSQYSSVTEYVATYYDFIGFNFNNIALQSRNVRQAVAYAINKTEIVANIYLDHAVLTDTPVSPQSWLYEPGVATYDYAPEQAVWLLSADGYTLNDDGFMEKDVNSVKMPLSFRIAVNSENNERVKIANYLNTSLKAVGIQSEIISVPFDEYQKLLSTKAYDIFIGGFNLSVIPDLTFALHSSQVEGGNNFFAYKDDKMDILLSQAASQPAEIPYKKAMSELQKYIADELPCISLAFRKTAVLSSKRINGAIAPTVDNIFYSISDWYMD